MKTRRENEMDAPRNLLRAAATAVSEIASRRWLSERSSQTRLLGSLRSAWRDTARDVRWLRMTQGAGA
jgi:hypothetical protein